VARWRGVGRPVAANPALALARQRVSNARLGVALAVIVGAILVLTFTIVIVYRYGRSELGGASALLR